MNAKKLLALSLACTLTLGLSACGGGQDAPSSSSPSGASDGDALKVGIILSTGGLGDKNFNDMTYAGAQQAEKDFGIEFDYVETQSASDFLPNYRMFAESGEYDLIIGLAADQTEAINEISIDFPEQIIPHRLLHRPAQRQRRLHQVAGADLPDRRGGRPGHPVRHGQGQQRKRGGRHPGPGSAHPAHGRSGL